MSTAKRNRKQKHVKPAKIRYLDKNYEWFITKYEKEGFTDADDCKYANRLVARAIKYKFIKVPPNDGSQDWYPNFYMYNNPHFLVTIHRQRDEKFKEINKYKLTCHGVDDFYMEIWDLEKDKAIEIFDMIFDNSTHQDLYYLGFTDG